MPNATRRGEAFNKYSEATRICFFFNPQLFLSGYGFRPSVSGESGSRRIRKFLNPLSRVQILEYAMNPELCGRQIRVFFYPVT